MSRFNTLIAGLFLAIALPGIANAEVVTVRDNPDNGGSVFATGLGRSVDIQVDGINRHVGAGVFSLQYDAGDGWTDFLTFCLQLSEYLTLPKEHERVAGADYFPSADDREALGILYGNFLDPATGLQNANTAAAMQAIIWEIVQDGADSFDLSAGSFKLFTSDVLSAANSLWALVISGEYDPIDIDVFSAPGTQDLITRTVPLPGSLSLLISGLAGLGFASRRQKAHA